MASTLIVILSLAAVIYVTTALMDDKVMFGGWKDDEKVCDNYADGREVVAVKKEKRMDCRVVCVFENDEGENETEKYNSMENQSCCNIGGGATGKCDDKGNCIESMEGVASNADPSIVESSMKSISGSNINM